MKLRNRVTLKQIAQVTGFHRTTVSRALRNHPALPSQTCKAVQAAAKKLGYQPDPVLSALSTYSRKGATPKYQATIAVISTLSDHGDWRNHHTIRRCYDGVYQRAGDLGFKVEELATHTFRENTRRLKTVLRTRNITSVIIPPIAPREEQPEADWEELSVVALGHSFSKEKVHRVTHHHRLGIKTAIQKLRLAGYRKFALITYEHIDRRTAYGWSAGFLEEQYRSNKDEEFFIWIQPPSVIYERSLISWVQNNKPDVILTPNDDIPCWLRDSSINIPRDLSLVHLDLGEHHGNLTGINQNMSTVGEAAVDLINSLYHANERGIPKTVRTVQISGDWIEGSSVVSH